MLADDEADAGKRAKSSVSYGPGHPEGDHCAICRFFLAGLHEGRCRLVKGVIEPMMWCRLFRNKP